MKKATVGSGCFWCTEAVFQQLEGITAVVSGYTGGHIKNPAYREVCEGRTGHAEVVQLTYDPEIVSYDTILAVFWKTHDPTTLNRQGNDVGTQYRSVIYYHDEEQRQLAQEYKDKLNASDAYSAPIVTEISPLDTFYPAEEHHQNYYNNHPEQGYCSFVVRPKVEKFKQVFGDKLKASA